MSNYNKFFQKSIKFIFVFFSIYISNVIISKAQATLPDFQDIGGLIKNFNSNILQNLVILLSGVAVVLFLYGLVRFIFHRSQGGESSKLKDDKKNMLWGLGALFVLVTLWGIIALAQDILGVDKNNNIHIPKICVSDNCDTVSSNPGGGGVVSSIATCPTGTIVATDGSCLPKVPRDTSCADGYIRDSNTNECVKDTNSPDTPDTSNINSKKSPGAICTVLSGGNSNTECTEGYYCKSSTQVTGSIGKCTKLP